MTWRASLALPDPTLRERARSCTPRGALLALAQLALVAACGDDAATEATGGVAPVGGSATGGLAPLGGTGGTWASGGVATGGLPTGGAPATGGAASTCALLDARLECPTCMVARCCTVMNACAGDPACAALATCILDNGCYTAGDVTSCAEIYCGANVVALPAFEAVNECLVVSCIVGGAC